jgi:hypothetical protein
MGTKTMGSTSGVYHGGETHNHLCCHELVAKVKYKTSQAKLSKLQRLACLGSTRTMTTAPTAAIEVLLRLRPFHLKM